jgi:hypothetical protein
MHIDTAAVGPTAGTRPLLDQLDDGKAVSLGVLSGADLCLLGGTEHPVCWEALNSAWQQLGSNDQEQLAETSTLGMLRRGLIEEQPPGRGVRALFFPACHKMSAELAVLLGARQSPALVIATHHEPRTPAITYFQLAETGAVVEEIPERAGDGGAGTVRSPLEVIFSYRLLSRDFAAAELARWALKPIPVARYQPKPPRLICLSGRAEGDQPASYQLTIYGNGVAARVYGPDISADLNGEELTRFMTALVARGGGTDGSATPLTPEDRGKPLGTLLPAGP